MTIDGPLVNVEERYPLKNIDDTVTDKPAPDVFANNDPSPKTITAQCSQNSQAWCNKLLNAFIKTGNGPGVQAVMPYIDQREVGANIFIRMQHHDVNHDAIQSVFDEVENGTFRLSFRLDRSSDVLSAMVKTDSAELVRAYFESSFGSHTLQKAKWDKILRHNANYEQIVVALEYIDIPNEHRYKRIRDYLLTLDEVDDNKAMGMLSAYKI